MPAVKEALFVVLGISDLIYAWSLESQMSIRFLIIPGLIPHRLLPLVFILPFMVDALLFVLPITLQLGHGGKDIPRWGGVVLLRPTSYLINRFSYWIPCPHSRDSEPEQLRQEHPPEAPWTG